MDAALAAGAAADRAEFLRGVRRGLHGHPGMVPADSAGATRLRGGGIARRALAVPVAAGRAGRTPGPRVWLIGIADRVARDLRDLVSPVKLSRRRGSSSAVVARMWRACQRSSPRLRRARSRPQPS